MKREEIQNLYIRTCRDSGWKMDYVDAAQLTARVIGIHPMEIWTAMGTLQTMHDVAKGKHPVCHRDQAA